MKIDFHVLMQARIAKIKEKGYYNMEYVIKVINEHTDEKVFGEELGVQF